MKWNQPATEILQGGEPRWILLGRQAKALPVLSSWWPFKVSSRVQWATVLAATATNTLSVLPGVGSRSVSLDLAYWQGWLADFSENWTAVFYIGNASHTRKAILFFVDQHAKVTAVAKIPLTPSAGGAILNEAAMLNRLAALGDLPVVLFKDEQSGVAAQTWLRGKAVSRGLTAGHIELLGRLANAGCMTRLSDRAGEIAFTLDKLDLPVERAILARSLELLHFEAELPQFVEHRDFAPWNLKRLSNGRLTLLDWEWAVAGSLPWQDLCRFFYIQDFLFKESGNVWEQLEQNPFTREYVRRFAIPQAALPGLTMHYLLRVLCTDWENRELKSVDYLTKQIKLLVDATSTRF